MAALYLHNALFGNEPSSPPPIHRRPLSGRDPHSRQLSSRSSVTIHASTSEHSHPTEPLLQGESSAYRDMLSRQPRYPSGVSSEWDTALSLDVEPASRRELQRLSEISLRKRIRRLRWASRSVLYLMGAWALFTTIRYAIAVTIYVSHDRNTILVVLASVCGFSVALVTTSILLSIFSRTLGWNVGLRSPYETIQLLLGLGTSVSVLGPAIMNVVLVFLWKNSSTAADSLRGRCSWDIDVSWSGTGGQCGAGQAKGWGWWLGAALFRLTLTLIAVMAYHFLSYKYTLARKPSRRNYGRNHFHSVSYPNETGSETLDSNRSYQVMVSTNHLPISMGRTGRQHSYSRSTELSEASHESGASSRMSQSRTRESSENHAYSRDGHDSSRRGSYHSPSSSEEDFLANESATSRYGTPIRHIPGQYSLSTGHGLSPSLHSSSTPFPTSEEDSSNFLGRYHSIVSDTIAEGEEAMQLNNDEPAQYPTPYDDEDQSYFIVGGTIQRMPTIESMGSREVTSILSRGDISTRSVSRPPTRQTTFLSDSSSSRVPSRSNSLSASIALSVPSSPLDPPLGATVSELGERMFSAGQHRPSTKSTATGSYYTAVSASTTNTTNEFGTS
ncbi:hypothetical protein BXZ70DRAFT_707715 [Cristinia sonorae]|uniref:Uncharacterized protein n=1 Tax=Cristinia sonorae TaxID=1940300 RepID=A0A8K0UFF8_9AGAR|nr:hypothetical protein BXZ70DRAFT_707715 [Cristinia sonorae]